MTAWDTGNGAIMPLCLSAEKKEGSEQQYTETFAATTHSGLRSLVLNIVVLKAEDAPLSIQVSVTTLTLMTRLQRIHAMTSAMSSCPCPIMAPAHQAT